MLRAKLPNRRQILHLAVGTAMLPSVSHIAIAQAYPVRPVRLIVGVAPGGPIDVLARLMGQWLSVRLGQPFVIDNRPGAGTNIATEMVVRSAPDGYTLLMVASSSAINATLYEKLNFNVIHDIAPVGSIIRQPYVMLVHPSVPAGTVPEFIGYAKAHPGKINMASAGNGTGQHVTGELFKMMTGVDMVHVPYRGGAPVITDLIAGRVQVMFISPAGLIDHIRTGKLRALAVTTETPAEALPDLPPLGDSVPGFEASSWNGIAAPKNTSREIIEKLNTEINAALSDPNMKARFTDLGGTVLPGSPADFAQLIAHETQKWAKVVEFSGAKP